jgi:hypothetical protein
MSYDRKLDQVCSHYVVDEPLYMDFDQMTIRPMRPVISGASVRVRVDGETDVPSYGMQIAPNVVGSRNGPFTVKEGVNDILDVKVNQGPTIHIVLPALTAIPMDQLVRLLSSKVPGVQFFVSGRRLGFRSIYGGRASSVRILGTSTFAATAGIVAKEYRGIDRYPGWTMIVAPEQTTTRPMQYIVFDRPLKSYADFVEISYTTAQQDCRRCGGLGIENDWLYGRTGEVIQVRDEALLIQECMKLFYTDQGSNPFHPWYGTILSEQIGRKIQVGGVIQNLITADISRAFGAWQSIKRQQEEKINQPVSDEEFPFRLINVNVQQSSADPTVFFLTVNVQNRSRKPLQIRRGVRVPEPLNLFGDTQQQGILRQSLRGYVLTG